MKVLYYQKNAFNYQKVELIKKKKFVIVILNLNYKVFVVYIGAFNIIYNISIEVLIHPLKNT